jgi:hypothetical protein
MEVYEGVAVQIHLFTTPAMDGMNVQLHNPAALTEGTESRNPLNSSDARADLPCFNKEMNFWLMQTIHHS